MVAQAVPPRQKTSPRPLPLPPVSTELMKEGDKEGVTMIFKAWENLARTELAEQQESEGRETAFTLFTLDDDAWKSHLPEAHANPMTGDSTFQRLVLATQLVDGQVDLTKEGRYRTVGGRTLLLTQSDNRLRVNEVEVKRIVRCGQAQICLLDKLLFIRPEDIEIGVERAERPTT